VEKPPKGAAIVSEGEDMGMGGGVGIKVNACFDGNDGSEELQEVYRCATLEVLWDFQAPCKALGCESPNAPFTGI
jgi:hypothetical protein